MSSRLTNLDQIQSLVQELQNSRDEILRENEKLANETVRLNKELQKRKEENVENKELMIEVCKLRSKLEEYKKLCNLENQANENLQNVVGKRQKEVEELNTALKSKEDEVLKIKKDFECFIQGITDENKKLKENLEHRETEYGKIEKLKKQCENYKTYIDELEKEAAECLNKIAYLQESIIGYDKANDELKEENKKLEKKVMKLSESRNFASEALDKVIDENEILKEAAFQAKADLLKVEQYNCEYRSEIEKYDQLTTTMEEQLQKGQIRMEQLEECLNNEKNQKVELQRKLEIMTEELNDEKCCRNTLETDIDMVKQAHKICEKRLRTAIQELETITHSFECYKQNIHILRQQIETRASRSCPPCSADHQGRGPELYSKQQVCVARASHDVSCQLLFKNSKRLRSLPSIQTNRDYVLGSQFESVSSLPWWSPFKKIKGKCIQKKITKRCKQRKLLI